MRYQQAFFFNIRDTSFTMKKYVYSLYQDIHAAFLIFLNIYKRIWVQAMFIQRYEENTR